MATSVSGEVFDVEERLFAGIVTGPLENYEDLLNSLGDVDVLGLKQRTLLHIAVRLGKVDWVEGLLGRGANPGLRDEDGKSVVELAQGMAEKYPEDGDRKLISKLVCLVKIGRDRAGSVALGGNSNTSGCLDTGMEAMRQEMSVLSQDMASICESLNDIQSRMATINSPNQEIAAIGNSIDSIKTGIAARHVLLSALERSITSLANKERPLIGTSATSIIAGEVVPSAHRNEEETRKECVEAMLRKTCILSSDYGKVSRAREWYEKVYAAGFETDCILNFMKNQENVSIEIDFDSEAIGRMKSKFRDHDGVEREGSVYEWFADFEERKVYVAGGNENEDWTISSLAAALSQLAFFLAFRNGGRPYLSGDNVIRQELERAMKQAEEYRRSGEKLDPIIRNNVHIADGGKLHWYIQYALGMNTQLEKEIYFTSAVPTIIAMNGWRDGMSILQRQVPFLLRFFQGKVMPPLLAASPCHLSSPGVTSSIPTGGAFNDIGKFSP